MSDPAPPSAIPEPTSTAAAGATADTNADTNTNADPSAAAAALASVITQVSPGQQAGGAAALLPGRAGGPARPTKLTKAEKQSRSAAGGAGTDKAAQRRKKKKKASSKDSGKAQAAGGAVDDAAVAAGEDGQGTAPAPGTAGQEGGSGAGGEATASSHGHDPSSTLVDATASNAAPATGDVGTETKTAADAAGGAKASDSKPLPAVAAEPPSPSRKSFGRDRLKRAGSKAGGAKPAASASPPPPPPPPKTGGGAARGAKPKRKTSRGGGAFARLLGILTCSSNARQLVDAESKPATATDEKRAGSGATTSASSSSPKPAAAAGNRTVDAQATPQLAAPSTASGGPVANVKAVTGAGTAEKRKLKGRKGAAAATTAAVAAGGAAAAASGNGALAPGSTTPKRSSLAPSRKGSFIGGVGHGAGDGSSTPGGGTVLPRDETGDVMSGSVVPPGSSFVLSPPSAAATAESTPRRGGGSSLPRTGAEGDDAEDGGDEESDEDDESEGDEDGEEDEEQEGDEEAADLDMYMDEDDEEHRLIMQGGVGIPTDEHGNPRPLLSAVVPEDDGRKCLVLDLDETLVHSSFKVIQNADFIVPVEIEGTVHSVYVIKRPGVDEFMRRMGELYEVVVFTASLSKYADPVLDILDIHGVVRHRLFRESCYNHKGNYVKDLSQLGRSIGDTIILDNSPASYIFHPNNAVPISSWFNDPHDTELTDLCPFLADLSDVEDVRAVLDSGL